MRGISRETSREVDRRATGVLQIPSICLMESAGAGCATLLKEMGYDLSKGVVLACGRGNNGGDGMVLARHLLVAGFRIHLLLLAEREPGGAPPDAQTQRRICDAMGLPLEILREDASAKTLQETVFRSGLVVDALFGTGLDRPLSGLAARLADVISSFPGPVVSLDLPSGLDCDTGLPLGTCVRADLTATFVAPKLGFSDPRSRAFTGEVHVVGIGAPLVWPLA